MAPNDAAIRASQKPETMTPRRRITRTLGRGGNTHTRGNQCAFYAGLGRNHNATASCSTGAMPLHPVGRDRVPLYFALQPHSRQGSARRRRLAA